MHKEDMIQQMIDFHKMGLDAMISVTGHIQDQASDSAQRMAERATRWPQSSLKSYQEWLATTRKCMQDIKPVTDQWFQSWKQMMDDPENPSPSAKSKQKAAK